MDATASAVAAALAKIGSKDLAEKEAGLRAIGDAVKANATAFQTLLGSVLPAVFGAAAEKPAVAKVAEEVTAQIVAAFQPFAVTATLPIIFEQLPITQKWQSRAAALNFLAALTRQAPRQLAFNLPEIVPALAPHLGDARKEVAKAAEGALGEACKVIGNKDLEPFLPVVVSCVARPHETADAVIKLSATTFVQAVESPALALMVPVLVRGLQERTTATKRRCCVIIENMCKLVEEPHHAAPFVPQLLPLLGRCKEEVSDPEARGVAQRAYTVLLRAAGETEEQAKAAEAGDATLNKAKLDVVLKSLNETIAKEGAKATGAQAEAVLTYIAQIASALINMKEFDPAVWSDVAIAPYFGLILSAGAVAGVTKAFLDVSFLAAKEAEKTEDDEPGEDLCDCKFSLAYGGKILLHETKLHLKRGQRYGLCGHNGCGKSTLMRAISNGQLEGFPSPDVVRTVYVEHDIQGDAADYTVLEYVFTEPRLKDLPRDEAIKALEENGFDESRRNGPVTALSGGWKMKLALTRATLIKPDIMLLDEPTNHLDKVNTAWIVNYITGLTNVTSLIVSHDSKFLDAVCTGIIHYEGFKLRKYRGNLSEFVKQKPEARSYYELAASPIAFKFPEPGILDGVKTKDKCILKMTKVTFTYPGRDKPTLFDISIYISLASRVMIVGPNGAGKSTMIKLLTAEVEPDKGTVWKHPNLRIAYVAQHAFHHLERHLDKTPNEYIQWRYATGEDREAAEKVTRQITEEEKKAMEAVKIIDGQKLVVEQILGRRKLKNGYEYEVQWVGLPMDKNTWMPRRWLEDNGFEKMVNQVDAREAAAAGAHTRPLTGANIKKHLEDVGLEGEFAMHSRIRGLSGGQKVKVVVAAAMWNNPHVLVLDEPTNYLDRDSLGALSQAIREFGGGVVMISHNFEFLSSLCAETWTIDEGRLSTSGESWSVPTKIAEKNLDDEVTDAAGNVIKVQKKVTLSRQEAKRKAKEKALRRKRGEEVSDTEDELEA